ncbi:hypothetical protein PENARI_c039G05554 [Penicillium arizonense]|uniref:Ras-GEF domain-containing protein n=1 Tax=Penicillium arizonense TaxID=1835702 RepID=A0A1F5L3Y6_PENAI|nr:hypothetical protein PENARI_c039G05554 [Penicillium arizonense]OGE47649.1 hypothetical protein PENARI_c039G05554 [Penicillium arizonense]
MEHVCSKTSLSVASTQINDETEHEHADENNGYLREEPVHRGPNDVRRMLLEKNKESIGLLWKLGLIDDEDTKSPRRAGCSPNQTHWEFDLSRLVQESPASLARMLSDESFQKFRSIPYEEFVRKAFGLSSEHIDDFLWHYELFAYKLYAKLVKEAANPLFHVKEAMEAIDADPFICAAVEDGCQKLSTPGENTEGPKPRLDARLKESLCRVVNPLKKVLSEPETTQSILQKLEVLRFCFYDFYAPLAVDWHSALDTSNEFLEQIRWFNISALAEGISRKDQALFSEYVVPAFTKEGQPARRILNTRWNHLANAVKRIMDAEIGLSSRIDDLAESLHRLRNNYSLTAVVQGVNASRFKTQALTKFGQLVNPNNDYQFYRREMSLDGISHDNALHFLHPAQISFTQNDMTWANIVVDDAAFYIVRADQQSSQMQFSPLNLVEAVEDNTGSRGDDYTSCGLSYFSTFFACFRC